MNNFKVSIGLEIHCEINTLQKMFSYSKNNTANSPNNNICEIDVALPGALPQINPNGIELALRLGKILNCKIANNISFDRKNYFYSDLPKGFQLTQYYNHIAENGYIFINGNNLWKKINIRNIQIEEDTAKQIKFNDFIEIDHNRTGKSLIEIITQPDFNSSYEVIEFIKLIRILLIDSKISEASFEKGSLRIDVNISISKTSKLNNRVEIKNINSLKAIKNAITIEIENQKKIYSDNKKVLMVTKTYDDNKNILKTIRTKNSDYDYYFINEPNLPIVNISKINSKEKLLKAEAFISFYKYLSTKLRNKNYLDLLFSNPKIRHFIYYYQELTSKFANFLFKRLANCNENIFSNPLKIKEIYLLYLQNKINKDITNNGKNFDELIYLYVVNKMSLNSIENKLLSNFQSEKEIILIIKKVIESNSDEWNNYDTNPKKYFRFFAGKIISNLKNKSQASVLGELIEKIKKEK